MACLIDFMSKYHLSAPATEHGLEIGMEGQRASGQSPHELFLFFECIHWEVRLVLRVTFSLLSEKFETSINRNEQESISRENYFFYLCNLGKVSYYVSQLFFYHTSQQIASVKVTISRWCKILENTHIFNFNLNHHVRQGRQSPSN